jgi:NTP pyrophosphatase (non-canonical NTP hydrolase)
MNLDQFATLLSNLERQHWPVKHPEHAMDAVRMLAVMEELGEIARIINKRALGRRAVETTQELLEEECGDLLLNLLAAVKSLGVNPTSAIRAAAAKWSRAIGAEVPLPSVSLLRTERKRRQPGTCTSMGSHRRRR